MSQRNELQDKVEFTSRKVQLLREQQAALINLKQRAENQLRDAKQAQQNLLAEQRIAILSPNDNPDLVVVDKGRENGFDITIKELEDRLNGLRDDIQVQNRNGSEDPEYLRERLDAGNDLLLVLNSRDAQLNSEHLELHVCIFPSLCSFS